MENAKPSINVIVSCMFEFSYQPQVYDVFMRGGEEWQNSDKMGQGCW